MNPRFGVSPSPPPLPPDKYVQGQASPVKGEGLQKTRAGRREFCAQTTLLSSVLYWIASATWWGSIFPSPSRSAMVRPTLSILVYARAESPSFSIANSRSFKDSTSTSQYFLTCLDVMALFENILVPLNLSLCIFLAPSTRFLIWADVAPFFPGMSSVNLTLGTSQCMSILSRRGPDSLLL